MLGPSYYWIKLQHALVVARRLARSGSPKWRYYSSLARSYKILYTSVLGPNLFKRRELF